MRRVYTITVERVNPLDELPPRSEAIAASRLLASRGCGEAYRPPEQPFEFFSENAGMAQDHADQLNSDPSFGRVTSPPRFVRWAEDGSL